MGVGRVFLGIPKNPTRNKPFVIVYRNLAESLSKGFGVLLDSKTGKPFGFLNQAAANARALEKEQISDRSIFVVVNQALLKTPEKINEILNKKYEQVINSPRGAELAKTIERLHAEVDKFRF